MSDLKSVSDVIAKARGALTEDLPDLLDEIDETGVAHDFDSPRCARSPTPH